MARMALTTPHGLAVLLSATCLALATAASGPLCFEQVSLIPALYLQEHPAGGKLVVAQQNGLLTLLTRPPVLSGRLALTLSTFLDLRPRTFNSGERGFLSFAFHPKFLSNGRFFVSYICNANLFPDCQGPCVCSKANGCNPASPLHPSCNGNTIVAEYSAGPSPGSATSLQPSEVRKLLKFGRPFSNHDGGHIWFGSDGLLYYTSGDGGNGGDPFNFAQNPRVFLGKILRLDVDNIPAGKPYGIPLGNPYVNRVGVLPEIYALGLRNPWRCSEDTVTKTLFCGDVGQDAVEEIDIVYKGGNYGWSLYEGTHVYKTGAPRKPFVGPTFQRPIFQYFHPPNQDRAVTGGLVYRAQRNKCLQGKYIFNDLYGLMFLGTVYPPRGHPRSYGQVNYTCATSSQCSFGNLKWSWGQDSAKEAYMLTDKGILRVVNSTACGVAC